MPVWAWRYMVCRSGEGVTAQGRGHQEGGAEKRLPLVGNVQGYEEGCVEGEQGEGRGKARR